MSFFDNLFDVDVAGLPAELQVGMDNDWGPNGAGIGVEAPMLGPMGRREVRQQARAARLAAIPRRDVPEALEELGQEGGLFDDDHMDFAIYFIVNPSVDEIPVLPLVNLAVLGDNRTRSGWFDSDFDGMIRKTLPIAYQMARRRMYLTNATFQNGQPQGNADELAWLNDQRHKGAQPEPVRCFDTPQMVFRQRYRTPRGY